MPSPDQIRIEAQRATPRIVRLWQALVPLRSCISFMNTGAHPDDETSEMLAALGFRDGFQLSYACSTRGEGGQNDIGSETIHDLGVLRTAEMERAAEILDMRLYWLSQSPEDPIFDFGFSKSGKETLGKWGRKRTLKRFVDILRTERPDIICPTFLDIPGQHGHHRAMTELAHEAFEAAADPDFADSDLAPWAVKKFYLPAWSGAGDAYDDDLPPPPATLSVKGAGDDPVTGWSWAQIGEQSRAFHRTQGMGRWVPHGEGKNWPLHLVRSRVAGDEARLESGLPGTLAEVASYAGDAPLEPALKKAQNACEAALAAFPDGEAIEAHAAMALEAIREARAACSKQAKGEVEHRLAGKERQLARVMRIASGVELRAALEQPVLRPGEETALLLEQKGPIAAAEWVLPQGWEKTPNGVRIGKDVAPSDPYPAHYDPQAPRLPAVRVHLACDGMESETLLPLETSPVVLPERSATLRPASALINLATADRSAEFSLGALHPRDARPHLSLPEGWSVEQKGACLSVTAPEEVAPGLYTLPLLLDGQPAATVNLSNHPHIGIRARSFPAEASVRVMNVTLPDARIGYVGGGNDRVCAWLRALGLKVVEISEGAFEAAVLDQIDTLLVGIFAMRTRPDLRAVMPSVHEWIEAGGNLVTLYHRPWDAWDPEAVPPRRLEIGKPSLRWRVTDENAAVETLLPDHPLLNTPNRIGEADWQGWHKERGLYFAKSWDTAYEPLLSMADPDEDAHKGALLSARIGAGRHSHVALILHHQMEKLVPGAFRLMANLLARP